MKFQSSHSVRLSIAWKRAFSLTELLVVIGIIGVIAAISIPVMAAFRTSARTAACTSNLRQIASATIQYAGDNNGYLPTRRSASGSTMGLQYVLRDPLATKKDKSKPETADNQKDYYLSYLLLDYFGDADIWECPANKAGWEASPSGVCYLINNRPETNPPYPFGKLIGSGTSSGDPETMPKTMSRMFTELDASRFWMIADADSINYPLAGFVQNKVEPPHKGKRNFAFFDGHVESRSLNDLPLHGNMGWPVP